MPTKVKSKSQQRRAKARAIGMRRAEQRNACTQPVQRASSLTPVCTHYDTPTPPLCATQFHGQPTHPIQSQAAPRNFSVPQNVPDYCASTHRHAFASPLNGIDAMACTPMAPAYAMSARPGTSPPICETGPFGIHMRGWCVSSDNPHHPAIDMTTAGIAADSSLRMTTSNTLAQRQYNHHYGV